MRQMSATGKQSAEANDSEQGAGRQEQRLDTLATVAQ